MRAWGPAGASGGGTAVVLLLMSLPEVIFAGVAVAGVPAASVPSGGGTASSGAGGDAGGNPDAGGRRSLFALPAPGRNTAPRPNEATYHLRRTADGGYVVDDIRFHALIAPDGHVTFQDIHGGAVPKFLGFPLQLGRGPTDQRPSLLGALQKTLRRDSNRPFPGRPLDGFSVSDPQGVWDPALRLPALGMPQPFIPLVSVTGTFDLTDELMSGAGQGWYRFEKAKFLSATFEFRLKMAVDRHRFLLKQSLSELPARLDDLWADPGYARREKRGIICLLWAEVDADDVDSRAAAETIVSWTRRKLPAAGPDAFGAGEIAACSQAAGRPFDPHADP
ncbi:MAG: hypothetical protein ABUS79_00825 [Pseudomonadota bacterium]